MNFKKIVFFVIVVHLFFISWAIRRVSNVDLLKKSQNRIVTQTVSLNEPRQTKTVSKPKEVKKEKPKEVKKEKPKEVKKEKPKPKEVKKEKPPPEKRKINQEMIAKAQENIAKINKNDKISQKENVKIPKAIKETETNKMVTSQLSNQEVGYRDELANRLKLLLRLPEFGKVNLKLTLNRRGEVQNIAILSAESEMNRKYVEENIPELTFPAFGSNFTGANHYTFLISLNNED